MKKFTHGQRLEWQAAQKRLAQRRRNRVNRSASFAITGSILAVAVIWICQSIARLTSGDSSMDYNYKEQPVGPFLRLVGSFIILAGGVSMLLRLLKKKPEDE